MWRWSDRWWHVSKRPLFKTNSNNQENSSFKRHVVAKFVTTKADVFKEMPEIFS